jgi:predicted ATPase
MLAMTQEAGGEVEVPASLRALSAARLDQLDPAERRVLECGSVEGEVFHRGAVQALTPEEAQVTPRLAALVRRELIRSERPQFSGEDGFRFRHLLIRDAAYDALPKSVRADLHQRFAAWLDQHGQELVERDEILGYHLERAAHYLIELGRPAPDLAAAASERLAAAGRRARWRYDPGAAHLLLQRAAALTERPDVHLVADLARTSSGPREMAMLMDDAVKRADEDDDPAAAAYARALAAYARVHLVEISTDEQERLAQEALKLLEAAEDHAGLAEVWSTLANGVYELTGRYLKQEHAAEQMLHEAALAGQSVTYPGMLSGALLYGRRPVREALRRLEAGIGAHVLPAETVLHDHPVAALLRAQMFAMDDRLEDARTLAAAAIETFRERGDLGPYISPIAEIEMLAGNYESAEEHLQVAYDYYSTHGLPAFAALAAAMRARALCWLGRYSEAEQRANEGRDLAHASDALAQACWRQAAALVRAERGDLDEAERLAREAVVLTQKTDSPGFQGDAFYDLAEVLAAADACAAAVAALNDALKCYERKGIIPLARRTRERLATHRPLQPETQAAG